MTEAQSDRVAMLLSRALRVLPMGSKEHTALAEFSARLLDIRGCVKGEDDSGWPPPERESCLFELLGRAAALIPLDTNPERCAFHRDYEHAMQQIEASLVKPLRFVPPVEEDEECAICGGSPDCSLHTGAYAEEPNQHEFEAKKPRLVSAEENATFDEIEAMATGSPG